MSETSQCAVCGAEIEGTPFTLSALTEPPSLLRSCADCAGAQYVKLRLGSLDVVVDRDDYIRADDNRLQAALDCIEGAMEDLGWSLEAVKIRAGDDSVSEPYEDD